VSASLEDRGFDLFVKASKPPAKTSNDSVLLGDVGAFGFNTFVVGLGTRVLSSHTQAGVDIMKLGGLLTVVGFGARMMLTGEMPKLPKFA
jgi:hypothetical protein